MAPLSGSKTPWHLWLVGILGLPWNGFGAFDYSMTQLRGEQHMRDFGMTDAQIAHMAEIPAWMTAVWAIGVWGGLLGTVLLLLKNRLAVPVFAISLGAFIISLVHAYILTNSAKIMGGQTDIMNSVILAGCLFFLFYARAMARKGVLR